VSINAVSLSHSAQLEGLKEKIQFNALLNQGGSKISFLPFPHRGCDRNNRPLEFSLPGE
jgi:hypothetical protein